MIAAFAAGLIASINPCGFAMLPAYAGFFLGLDSETSKSRAITRAFWVAAIMSLGFLAVFGVFGLAFGLGGVAVASRITAAVPWIAIVIGSGLIFLGIALLFGYELKVSLPTGGRGTSERSARAVFVFGSSYALASLSCALPVFLIVVSQTVTADTFLGAVGSFIAYAAGMALVITAVTVALALGQDQLVNAARRVSRQANRVAGVLLAIAGAFIVFYWTLVLRLGPEALVTNPITRWVEGVSGDLTGIIGDRPLLWLGIFGALVMGAWLYASSRKQTADSA